MDMNKFGLNAFKKAKLIALAELIKKFARDKQGNIYEILHDFENNIKDTSLNMQGLINNKLQVVMLKLEYDNFEEIDSAVETIIDCVRRPKIYFADDE